MTIDSHHPVPTPSPPCTVTYSSSTVHDRLGALCSCPLCWGSLCPSLSGHSSGSWLCRTPLPRACWSLDIPGNSAVAGLQVLCASPHPAECSGAGARLLLLLSPPLCWCPHFTREVRLWPIDIFLTFVPKALLGLKIHFAHVQALLVFSAWGVISSQKESAWLT